MTAKRKIPDDIQAEITEYEQLKPVDIAQEMKSKATSNGEKKLPEVLCAQILMTNHKFLMIGNDSKAPLGLYLGDNVGIYTTDLFQIQKLVYQEEKKYTEKQVNDVIFKIKMQCSNREQTNDPQLIPVNNGIYNLKTKALEPFNVDRVFTNKVATNWVENAPKPTWDVDEWLNSIACGDNEVITLFWQLINECLNGNYTRGKYFILVGDGNAGKGTFQKMLINLIGKENVSNLRMEQLSERFSPSSLVGKVANIGDDISSDYIKSNENVQSIATGDSIVVEEKGKQSYSVTLRCAMVFSANVIPKVQNKTLGTYRRMTIIPFNADFNGEIEDRSIKNEKLNRQDVREYLLFKALQQDFDKFIEPKAVAHLMDEYKEMNDPLLEFYKDIFLESNDVIIERLPTGYVYQQYKDFCFSGNYMAKSLRTFVVDFLKLLGDGYEKKKARPKEDFLTNEYYIKLYDKPLQCFLKI